MRDIEVPPEQHAYYEAQSRQVIEEYLEVAARYTDANTFTAFATGKQHTCRNNGNGYYSKKLCKFFHRLSLKNSCIIKL